MYSLHFGLLGYQNNDGVFADYATAFAWKLQYALCTRFNKLKAFSSVRAHTCVGGGVGEIVQWFMLNE